MLVFANELGILFLLFEENAGFVLLVSELPFQISYTSS